MDPDLHESALIFSWIRIQEGKLKKKKKNKAKKQKAKKQKCKEIGYDRNL